ncbi:glycoside hydrolase family 88 protein [Sphingomonas sp. MMS12-HWE2-04]|uniref:glycoside hydrolase family 88 protein n=1 Tax=Sphingomonas sp. MMS12-HWE2-04 TaxID=3234199 RepID=UPI00384CE04D
MHRRLGMALAALPLLATPAFAQQAPIPITERPVLPPRPDTRFDGTTLPDPARVRALLDYTALAQIDMLATQPLKLRNNQIREASANWVAAAFYTGAARLARTSERPEILRFLREVAEHYNYGFRGGATPRSMINADDQAIGELYLELHARTGAPGMILPLRQRIDYTLPSLVKTPAPPQLTWWWCDALFMAPPVLARLAAISHDPAYLNAMDVQWWRTYDRLWDPAERLYFRDERFVTRRSENGKKIFWSRGIGWVVGGYARVLESMPADYPTRPRYIATFRAMIARIAELQRKEDGMWTASMLDPAALPGPEASGSAFMVYAMAWGINHGILDRKTYLPHVLKGWAGLTAAVQPNGLLGHVQRAGDQPVPTAPGDSALYGTGALILAGLEIEKLGAAPTSLPLAEPARDLEPLHAYPVPPLPADATPQQRRDYARGAEERVAMRALAYDPAPPQVVAPTHGAIAMPRMELPMPPPPADRQAPRAYVAVAPDRYDDILWENDRTAHRIYGRALEAAEPPSTSGIDAWGKNVRWPFMRRQLDTGKQHDYHGDGIDFYNVGTTRGAGGLGIWFDNKLWTSRNYRSVRILDPGPKVADFEVTYAPWPVDVARKVWETRRFTLPLGTNFTRLTSTIGSDSKAPLTVAIGIAKRGTSQTLGSFSADRAAGKFSLWGPTDADKGTMAVALMVDPKSIADVREDADNYLVLLTVTPGKPFVYYMGAAWDKGLDFHDAAGWGAYVATQTPDFSPPAK